MKSRSMPHINEPQKYHETWKNPDKNNYVLYKSICTKYSEKDKYMEMKNRLLFVWVGSGNGDFFFFSKWEGGRFSLG